MSNANPFVPKGRQPKFRAIITIHELLNIPLNNGYVYVRWHVKDSGHAEGRGRTDNAAVKDYKAVWNMDIDSKVRMMIDKNGVLQDSLVVFQVFQEIMEAKMCLGWVPVNLAEYTGVEAETRRFLLQKSKVNCTLKVTVDMKQLSGDTDFKAPVLRKAQVFGGISGLMMEGKELRKKGGDRSSSSIFSRDSQVDVMSLDMYRRTLAARSDLPPGELEPSEVIEVIFSGGDGWAPRDKKSGRRWQRASSADATSEMAANGAADEHHQQREEQLQDNTSWIL